MNYVLLINQLLYDCVFLWPSPKLLPITFESPCQAPLLF